MEKVPRSSGLQISTVKMLVLTIPLLTPTSILVSENIKLQARSQQFASNKRRDGTFCITPLSASRRLDSGMLIKFSDKQEEEEKEDLEM